MLLDSHCFYSSLSQYVGIHHLPTKKTNTVSRKVCSRVALGMGHLCS